MPPKSELTKGKVMEGALSLVRECGAGALNARALAKRLHCSTQPLFRLYRNMEELKADLKQEMDKVYRQWMEEGIREENRLVTQGCAYVEFSRRERGIFQALFLDHCMAGSSLSEIADAPWNRRTVENAARIAGLSTEGARNLFLNVWLYSHGMASQLLSNEIDLPEEKVKELHEKAFAAFSRVEKENGNGR